MQCLDYCMQLIFMFLNNTEPHASTHRYCSVVCYLSVLHLLLAAVATCVHHLIPPTKNYSKLSNDAYQID